jgi:hypothetical protein
MGGMGGKGGIGMGGMGEVGGSSRVGGVGGVGGVISRGMANKVKVVFYEEANDSKVEVEAEEGLTMLDAAIDHNIDLEGTSLLFSIYTI